MNHYDYLDRHLVAFLESLGVSCGGSARGLITAHGDKFYGYRMQFEEVGLAFPHGVANGLLTYLRPFADEARPNGFGDPLPWILSNKDRFLPLLPPLPTGPATNAEIDSYVLDLIVSGRAVRSLTIGGLLEQFFEGRLKLADKHSANRFHNACEHANRACKRLRAQGKIAYRAKQGWAAAAKSQNERKSRCQE